MRENRRQGAIMITSPAIDATRRHWVPLSGNVELPNSPYGTPSDGILGYNSMICAITEPLKYGHVPNSQYNPGKGTTRYIVFGFIVRI